MKKTSEITKFLFLSIFMILVSCSDGDDSDSSDEGSRNQDGGCSEIEEGCDLPKNSFYLSGESFLYNSNVKIAGYQFDITNTSGISVSGGDSEEYGLSVAAGPKTVLGVGISGEYIPSGCGVLINISLDSQYDTIENIIVSTNNGTEINFEYYDCQD